MRLQTRQRRRHPDARRRLQRQRRFHAGRPANLARPSLPGRRVAVLGDMAELGESSGPAHAEVGRRAGEIGLDQLFAVGTRAAEIAAAARHGGLGNVVEFAGVEEAAQAVKDYFVRPGDAVLVKASRAMRLERITESLRN